MTTTLIELKKETEEAFEKYMREHKVFDSNAIELAKSFISTLLATDRARLIEEGRKMERERVVEMIRNYKVSDCDCGREVCDAKGYNKGLSVILSALSD